MMSFEGIVRKLSAFVAAVAVFFFAAGMYLSLKGFVVDDEHNIILVPSAKASETKGYVSADIDPDLVLPSNHILGDKEAPVTIYEYSSLGCSHCADFHLSTLPKIKEKYIDKGIVKLIFVDFPIDRKSMSATMVALCAKDGKYFEMVELLFKKQREWWLASNTEKKLKQYAALGGLNAEQVDICLKNKDVAQEVLNNRQQAVNDLKIQGTPAFVIDGYGQREIVSGALSFDTMSTILDEYIALGTEEITNVK